MTQDRPPGSSTPIHKVRENLVYHNRFVDVFDDPVIFADGSDGSFLRIVESAGRPGVAMLALCDDQIALVRVYRYALGSWEWAIPRGFAHSHDADASARAELAEELGWEPDELIPIGTVTPNSGLLTSNVQLYLARYATIANIQEDRREVAEVKWIDIKALRSEIVSGHMKDTFTLSALTCAQAHGHLGSM